MEQSVRHCAVSGVFVNSVIQVLTISYRDVQGVAGQGGGRSLTMIRHPIIIAPPSNQEVS